MVQLVLIVAEGARSQPARAVRSWDRIQFGTDYVLICLCSCGGKCFVTRQTSKKGDLQKAVRIGKHH
jgi:hypothetical protein